MPDGRNLYKYKILDLKSVTRTHPLNKDGFANALKAAEANGEAQLDDVDGVAWYLTNSAMGLGPLSKAGVPHSALQLVSEQILKTIRI